MIGDYFVKIKHPVYIPRYSINVHVCKLSSIIATDQLNKIFKNFTNSLPEWKVYNSN